LTDRQLVDMITATPAQIAGVDDVVGAIREGLYADLLIISGDRNDPYHALTRARAGDVQLVLISGQPVFGAPIFMEAFWKLSELSGIDVEGTPKMVRLADLSLSFSDLTAKLQAALESQGTNLAPLTEYP
jgi:hypothetical protein